MVSTNGYMFSLVLHEIIHYMHNTNSYAHTHRLCTYNYTLHVIRKVCDVIIQKLKFVLVKLSFNAYNGVKHRIMDNIIPLIIHA